MEFVAESLVLLSNNFPLYAIFLGSYLQTKFFIRSIGHRLTAVRILFQSLMRSFQIVTDFVIEVVRLIF